MSGWCWLRNMLGIQLLWNKNSHLFFSLIIKIRSYIKGSSTGILTVKLTEDPFTVTFMTNSLTCCSLHCRSQHLLILYYAFKWQLEKKTYRQNAINLSLIAHSKHFTEKCKRLLTFGRPLILMFTYFANVCVPVCVRNIFKTVFESIFALVLVCVHMRV